MRRIWQGILLLFISGVMGTSPIYAAASDGLYNIYRNHNIPLIDNRFRIDPRIKKVTFLLHRKPGSPSGILVRPDGSKIYPWQLPKNVKWLENQDVDVVTITQPMPGPWQALVESASDQNVVQVLSQVTLQVDQFPLEVFIGEKLPLKARLLNHGKPLIFDAYMDDVLLKVTSDSQGSAADAIYAHAHDELTTLRDDGKKFDGYPRDGTYTGYVSLDLPAGKYMLKVSTANEVFTRAYQQMLLVSPQPYSTKLILPKDDKPLTAVLSLDKDEIKPDSLVIDGSIHNNVSWNQHFQIRTRNAPDNLEFALPTPEKPGSYRMNATVYATTVSGRPLVMKMPEKTFYIAPKVVAPPQPTADELAQKTDALPEPKKSGLSGLQWLFIGGIILIVLAAGGVGFIWLRKRKAFKRALSEAAVKADENIELPPQPDEPQANISPSDAVDPGIDAEPDLTLSDEDEESKKEQ